MHAQWYSAARVVIIGAPPGQAKQSGTRAFLAIIDVPQTTLSAKIGPSAPLVSESSSRVATVPEEICLPSHAQPLVGGLAQRRALPQTSVSMDADSLERPELAEHLPRLLSMADVADVLSVRTVRGMVANGELPIVRLNGRTVRFRPEDVRDLFQRRAGVGSTMEGCG